MDSTDATNSPDINERDTLREQEELVRKLIAGFFPTDPDSNKPKMSVADLIRLLQFQREIERQRPADIIEVRWIDPKQEI